MKKLLLPFLLLQVHCIYAQHIDKYRIEVLTKQPYKPLVSGTNLTEGRVWDWKEKFKLPMGFTSKVGGVPVDSFSYLGGFGISPAVKTATGEVKGILSFFLTYLEDRGWMINSPKSPIRYQTDGVSPNKIFKFEIFNAGFFNEEDNHHTLDDSVNFQIWQYETSDIIEVRFGDARVTWYFQFIGNDHNSPLIGYCDSFNLSTLEFPIAYSLAGNTTSPSVASFTTLWSGYPLKVMDTYPESGTVYRFIPYKKPASIGEKNAEINVQIFPTVSNSEITIVNNTLNKGIVTIYDINGLHTGISIAATTGENKLGIRSLASGNYFVIFQSDKERKLIPIVKQ